MPNKASERLKRHREEIMRRWEARAYKEVAAALHQESLALRDSLPEYLDQLVDALSTTIDRTELRVQRDREDSLRVGGKHGRERARSLDYTMEQLIFEYHILRQIIFDVMEVEAPLAPVEREIIISSVEQAVNDAASQFSATLSEIQQQLTRTLAHDLRSPLMTAKTGAVLILRRPDDVDHCIRVAGRISASVDQIDAMIKDLLDASLLKAGHELPMQFEECDLSQVTRQVADEFNFIYGNRFVVDGDAPMIGYWDATQLRRVLENLTTNAVKYGEPGTPITFGLKRNEERVTLSLHNHGKPIPPDERAILFQQFRRVRPEGHARGWGIGLSVVKGIVEAHFGTVKAESAEGKGTTFLVELPPDSRRPQPRQPAS